MALKKKKVSIKQCVGIMIGTLIILAIAAAVPFAFGSSGLVFNFQHFPIIGDAYAFGDTNYLLTSIVGFESLIGTILPDIVALILSYVMNYFMLAFIVILLADFLFAFLLILFRSKIMRIIFRTFSIIFGILMIFIMLASVFYIVGMVGYILSNGIADFMVIIGEFGLIAFFVTFILSAILINKQFHWFTVPKPLMIVRVDDSDKNRERDYRRYDDRYYDDRRYNDRY